MGFEIALICVGFVVLLVLTMTFICYSMVFYSSPKKRVKNNDEYSLQQSDIYKPYHKIMIEFIEQARSTSHKKVEVQSFDGLTLRGRYYEFAPSAPIEIIFHGYRGDSESDLSGAVKRCFSLKRSVLLVDQRASGKSDGKVISFGIKESKDCLSWINYVIEHIDKNAVIYLCGVSMGASTVMIACAQELPKNVIAVIADCGFTSAKDIICKVIKYDMKLPAKLLYPFVKLGAKIFGKFDLEETSPIEALKHSRLPVLFIHGNEDDYVPYEMSLQNYKACTSKKQLLTIETAGHGLAYIVNPAKYLEGIKSFDKFITSHK